MTPDEHQRERMRAFLAGAKHNIRYADSVLEEFDKRFPAPSAAAPVMPMAMAGTINGTPFTSIPETQAELASLRQKARYWDAVASGKVRLYIADDSNFYVAFDTADDAIGGHQFPTAAEAVQAAIDAGALK